MTNRNFSTNRNLSTEIPELSLWQKIGILLFIFLTSTIDWPSILIP